MTTHQTSQQITEMRPTLSYLLQMFNWTMIQQLQPICRTTTRLLVVKNTTDLLSAFMGLHKLDNKRIKTCFTLATLHTYTAPTSHFRLQMLSNVTIPRIDKNTMPSIVCQLHTYTLIIHSFYLLQY